MKGKKPKNKEPIFTTTFDDSVDDAEKQTARNRRKRGRPAKDSPESVGRILEELHALFEPHPGQMILDNKFANGAKRVFAQCGRNFGKSQYGAYWAVKRALTVPNSHCYIIFPEKEQGREVLWASGVLKGMIPKKYLALNRASQEQIVKNELRITLKNGSYIKIMGADDPNSLRGIKPHAVVLDEYRDFKNDVYDVVEANLLGKDASLFIGSTPPDVVCHYSKTRDHYISEAGRGNHRYFYLELPTEANPHISRETLADIKRRLFAVGDFLVWQREYMAKFIPGGAAAIIPTFIENKETIVKNPVIIHELLKGDPGAWDFYGLFDPASTSVFAVLLAAHNKFTSQLILLDEIYERDRKKTSPSDIWERTQALKKLYCKDLSIWVNIYDEAEAWFYNHIDRYEVLLEHNENLAPTNKQSRDKNEDLSIIKDLTIAENKLIISERCPMLIEEIENYATNEKGQIPKKKDHQIDNFRYLLAASEYRLDEAPNYAEYLERQHKAKITAPGFNEWYTRMMKQQDWTRDIDESAAFNENIFVEDLFYGEINS